MSDKHKSVLLATKSEMRELRENPSIMHYVLICKGAAEDTNDLTNIPPSLLSILQEFGDVFPDELPPGLPPLRGIEHRIDLIPGAPLPNRAAYRTNPEETKEIEKQIQDLLSKGMIRESLSPCAVPVILFLRVIRPYVCVWIVDQSMPLPFVIGTLFLVLDDMLDELCGATIFSKIDLQ